MIQLLKRHYIFGEPIPTNSLVTEDTAVSGELFSYSDWQYKAALKQFCIPLADEDRVYGFGQSLGGFNKRGMNIVSYCTDDAAHTEEKKSLYGAHNFFLIKSGAEYTGVFFDASCEIIYDIGSAQKELLLVQLEEADFGLLILCGEDLKVLLAEWFRCIGQPYLPPRWGLGYIQSRWGYKSEEDIRDVIEGFAKNNIPLDGVCLDIDYMERFKDFTIDRETFADMEGLIESTRESGIHLVPIIDAGIKIEAGYTVYEEGIQKGFFCENRKGDPFVGAVWPGLVHFPDFLNSEARQWFGDLYHGLLDMGFDGFWNDMNEPALFFTPERLAEVKAIFIGAEPENLDVGPFFELLDSARTLLNHDSYHHQFYHRVQGEKVVHRQVHNQYGYRMTQSAYEGFRRYDDKRKLMFSRASLIGAHRYGGLWMGDNSSWWQHLRLNMSMLVGMNLSGFLYIGADTGGFSHDVEPELLIRWHQLSLFTPLFRNHSALGTKNQEPYVFEPWVVGALKTSIEWRYRMMFWQFSELLKATLSGDLLFKPMEWVFEDAEFTEDQVVYADTLLLTPVLDRNQTKRIIYLPEKMWMLRLKRDGNYGVKVLDVGIHRIEMPLNEQVFFLKMNRFIVLNELMHHENQLSMEKLTVIGGVEGHAELSLFHTDETYAYEAGRIDSLKLEITKESSTYAVHREGFIKNLKVLELVLLEESGDPVLMRLEVSEDENVAQ